MSVRGYDDSSNLNLSRTFFLRVTLHLVYFFQNTIRLMRALYLSPRLPVRDRLDAGF